MVAERNARLDFRDAHTMRAAPLVPVPCAGVDHMDFTADGRYLLASCEFSGQLVKVDVAARARRAHARPPAAGAMPQDVKLAPDGRIFYVADMMAGGVWGIDARTLPRARLRCPPARGAHGLYPSRDARCLYVSNRGEGTISVISFATAQGGRHLAHPGRRQPRHGRRVGRRAGCSGSPAATTARSTRSTRAPGGLLARIPVGSGPHGLCVWPQPGRYSLGHTGILR